MKKSTTLDEFGCVLVFGPHILFCGEWCCFCEGYGEDPETGPEGEASCGFAFSPYALPPLAVPLQEAL